MDGDYCALRCIVGGCPPGARCIHNSGLRLARDFLRGAIPRVFFVVEGFIIEVQASDPKTPLQIFGPLP